MVDVDPRGYGVPPVMRDVPDWNRDERALFRGDARTPAEIRADGGFRPPYMSRPDWQNDPSRAVPDIAQHVGGATNAFVSTSTDRGVARDFAITGHVYVINAPGGIYTDPTLRPTTGKETHGEGEVLFPGGIDWRYVKGWHEMRYEPGSGYVMGEFQPNPDYVGDQTSSAAAATDTTDTPGRPEPRQDAQPPTDRPTQYGPSTPDATRPPERIRRDTRPGGGAPAPGSLGDRMGRLDDPRLDALRPHLRSTEGGMSAFAPPSSPDGRQRYEHQNEQYTANQVPRIPGQFVVDMHGSADAVRIGDTPLSPRDLADVIRANPDYDGGPVSLLGCGTGSRPDGFAAELARELGVQVTAPSSDAWVDHNGNVFSSSQAFNADTSKPARPTWPPNGEWNTFSPHGEQTVHRGPYPPGHTPSWADDTPPRPIGDPARRGEEAETGQRSPEAERIDRDAERELKQARDARNDQLKQLQQETSQRIAQAERDAAPRLAEVEQGRERRLAEIRENTDRRLAEIERERAQRLAEAGDDQARQDAVNAELDQRAADVERTRAEQEHAANREADRQAEPTRRELDQKFAEIVADKDQRRERIEQDFANRSEAAETERARRHEEARGERPTADESGQPDQHRAEPTQPRADDGSWRPDRAQDNRPGDEQTGEDQARDDQTRDDQVRDQAGGEETGDRSAAPPRRDSRSDGRLDWPTDPASGAPLRYRDLDALGLTEQQVDWWRDGRAPLGMDPDQFRRFQSELGDLLRANGIDPDRSQVRLVGSSVRFYSGWNKTMEGEHGLTHTPESRERLDRWQGPDRDGMSERRPFDVQHRLGLKPEPSDYDLSFYSDDLVTAARQAWDGEGDFSHPRQGHVDKKAFHDAIPGLAEFAQRWQEKTGRKIGFRLFGLENEPQQRRAPNSNPTDGNWLLDLSERDEPARPPRPVDPASGYEIQPRDQEFLGYSDEQLQWWSEGSAPLGMTPRQFHDFQASLADALRAEGIDPRDVDVRLKGSGVNAFSNPRKTLDNAPHTDESRALMDEWFGDDPERPTSRPFDSMHRLGLDQDKSDFDVQIRSDDMVRIARERLELAPPPDVRRDENGDPHFAHPKYGFVDKAIMREQFPELNKWVEHWEREFGREVAPALFGLDDGPRQDSHLDAEKAQRGWPMLGPDASPLGDRPDPVDPDTVGSARPDDVDDTGPERPRRPASEPPADSPVLTDAPESPPPPPKIDHGAPVHHEDGSWEWKGYTLDARTNQAVDDFIPEFARVGHGENGDGGIRGVMQDIEQRVPYTRLEGLEHDLKGADRLKEKVAERLREDDTQTPEQVLREIPDGIRYTFSLDPENYTSGLARISDELKQRGFVEVQQVNSWNRDIPYKGVNTRWLDPDSGLRFEVQFHTPESWHVKSVTHDAYEHEKNMTLSEDVRNSWNKFQEDYFNTIPKPSGAETITTFKENKPR